MSWTEEKVNKLKELLGKGQTASQIAEIIGGVSRNAVIGKAHRLNLSAKIKTRSSINHNNIGKISDSNNSLKKGSRKNRFRSNNDRSFKKNGKIHTFNSDLSVTNDFSRKKINRNINTSKLIEKYTELAKEALSNGDKILSENYFQHADHFTRVSEEKNLGKINKNLFDNQNNPKIDSDTPKISSD